MVHTDRTEQLLAFLCESCIRRARTPDTGNRAESTLRLFRRDLGILYFFQQLRISINGRRTRDLRRIVFHGSLRSDISGASTLRKYFHDSTLGDSNQRLFLEPLNSRESFTCSIKAPIDYVRVSEAYLCRTALCDGSFAHQPAALSGEIILYVTFKQILNGCLLGPSFKLSQRGI